MTTDSVARIIKGEDKSFTVKLRDTKNDPVDLTNAVKLQMKFQASQGTYHTIDDDDQPAQTATETHTDGSTTVTFTADTAGEVGNSITLSFDGSDDVDTVVSAWNTANPSNTVSHDGAGTEVLPAAVIELTQGLDSFKKLEVIGNAVLGKIQVKLTESDTNAIRSGKRLPIHIIVDRFQQHPAGERIKAVKENAIEVVTSPQ